MKALKMFVLGAALASGCGAALAAEVHAVHPSDRVIIEGRVIPGGGIASGGTSYEDDLLADEVAFALRDSRRLSRPGMTATVVANRGEVTISGSADSYEQAQRAERIARSAAGPHRVIGAISTTGG